ncbi:MAG: MAPEG family protein [Cellvibrionales bacterium]|nr:MAPEG family protein [Cellvibrionales bacterium]
MSIALWCLFAAGVLHFASKLPLIYAQTQESGGYDNRNPRAQQAALQGWGERALAVHKNQMESFPLFAAGILVALFTDAAPSAVDYLALAYILARLAYLYFYLTNAATVRSLVWLVGLISSLALLCSPIWG